MLMNIVSRKFAKFETKNLLTEFMESVKSKHKLSEKDGVKLHLAYLRELKPTGDYS